ncbi:MAG: histone deacetylase [Nannocystaceae bacterium]
MPETLLLHDDAMIDHDPGVGHPERPDRLRAIVQALHAQPIAGARMEAPRPVSDEDVLRVHTEAHLRRFESARGEHRRFDPDTVASPASVVAARLAAGAAVDAVDAVLDGRADNAFALSRPPGHHAEPARTMGFCFLNNVAIAAEHALARPEIERVLVVDWDVHHGNGTQAAFYGRRDVLFASTHQHPLYPGTGALAEHGVGAGEGYTLNVPLPGGSTDGDYRRLFTDLLAPAAERFDPDLILVSAGFDAHRLDPVGGMALSAEGFADLCATMRALADAHASGRLVLVLEGGYDLQGLSASTHACLQVLTGVTPPDGSDAPSRRGGAALLEAAEHHRRHWPV